MTTVEIRGIPISFPFEPYELQKNYMEKVLECLQNETNGVLESPTGTGKTLSLLCSTLAWLQAKKAQLQLQRQTSIYRNEEGFAERLLNDFNNKVDTQQSKGRAFLGLPTIIYASRTHSQLQQAMNELKRTNYNHMKACVLGSREQMCIHPEVMREPNNATRVQLCRMRVHGRSCHFYNKIERKKNDPAISGCDIMDLEDIVKLGNTHKFCPYYMSKELQKQADIVFMPYNYLLDPKIRKSLGVVLENNVIILDEAHNIERMCEEAASLEIKSTDITLAIEEVTGVMKAIDVEVASFDDDTPKDFTPEELCILKEMLLNFETAFDAVDINPTEGSTFDGDYIYTLLGEAGITQSNSDQTIRVIDNIVQYLANASQGPFQRKGNGLQLFSELLIVAFKSKRIEFREQVKQCYKVHLIEEEPKKKRQDNWLSKATNKSRCRILNYWCLSPGFGMSMLMDRGIRCVILTSGTLAPLNPLISELQLTVNVRLENPHVVKGDQVCVKIVPKGPDGTPLICNYQNRDNTTYITSLGNTIVNVARQVPHGLLIFFPSYPIMQKYQQFWQENGTWSSLNSLKPTYVEPKDKESFNSAMTEFYAKVNDPVYKGAIFMGVCRGKVSEGLDFADGNGRAVLITGLPYPPLKDPRVILKKRYLDKCNARNKEFLKGDDWYSLEAVRAVNQAIGRVIRHRYDYGAILLLDSRFNSPRVKNSLSMWLRGYIKVANNFGEIIRDLRKFFSNAQNTLPAPKDKPENPSKTNPTPNNDTNPKGNFNFKTETENLNPNGSVVIHKRPNLNEMYNPVKKKKIVVVRSDGKPSTSTSSAEAQEYILMAKRALDEESYTILVKALGLYRNSGSFDMLRDELEKIFAKRYSVRYLLTGLEKYIRKSDKEAFHAYLHKNDISM